MYKRQAPYYGEQVIQDIQSILEVFHPQIIYLPHPSDLHSDHWATYNFVKEALERLRQKGSDWIDDAKVYLYLVHFGRIKWPPLWGYTPPVSYTHLMIMILAISAATEKMIIIREVPDIPLETILSASSVGTPIKRIPTTSPLSTMGS